MKTGEILGISMLVFLIASHSSLRNDMIAALLQTQSFSLGHGQLHKFLHVIISENIIYDVCGTVYSILDPGNYVLIYSIDI